MCLGGQKDEGKPGRSNFLFSICCFSCGFSATADAKDTARKPSDANWLRANNQDRSLV